MTDECGPATRLALNDDVYRIHMTPDTPAITGCMEYLLDEEGRGRGWGERGRGDGKGSEG